MQLQPMKHLRRVYCAGPLFNEPERRQMVELADVLVQAGFEVFVPHRDGMEFAQVHPYLTRQGYDSALVGQLLHEAVFALDTYQVIAGCGLLVCNLNGRVPDEGAVAETTMAWMLGKPLVFYKDDCRSKVAGRDNPLVVGMGNFEVLGEMLEIPAALEAACTVLKPDPETLWTCPPHLSETLSRGKQLSQRLAALGETRPNNQVAQIIVDLFDPDCSRLNNNAPLV